MYRKRLNLRKVAAIVACLAVCIVFVGCNDDNNPPIVGDKDVVYVDSRGNKVVVPYGSMSCVLRIEKIAMKKNGNEK